MRPWKVAERTVAATFASLLLVSCGGGGGSTTSGSNSGSTISVSVAPASATVAPGGSQQYTATVVGTSNMAVTWSAASVSGGNSTVGTISSSGLYTAPSIAPNPPNVTITAISVADSTKSGTAVAVEHDNQDFQNSPIKLGTTGGNATDSNTSGSKIFCCSGTLGSLVSRGGSLFILSNNHVLDKSDQGATGDPISHPGLAETNCGQNSNKIVANLSQAAPLKTSNVDTAIAQIVGGQVDLTGSILDLAAVGQPAPPSLTLATASLNQPVAKSGEATGLTCSTVNSINLSVKVDYSTQCQGGTTFSVTFTNQISIVGGQFSGSGDSGSLIVTSDTARPVALLYAGSSTGTVGNPIQDVLTALTSNGVAPQIVGGVDHAVACPAATQLQVTTRERAFTTTRLPESEVARAATVKNRWATELMQDPAVTGVGVGQSEDNPSESAIVVFTKDQPRIPIPVQIDGVRTKLIPGSEFRPEQTTSQQRLAVLPGVSDAEVSRARTAKQRHADELMSNPAILGVGVGASSDNTSEGAVVVFVEQGKSVAVPADLDGTRTRVIVTDRFRTYDWGTKTVKACSRR